MKQGSEPLAHGEVSVRFTSYERSECFIEVVRLLLHIDEVDVSLKTVRVVILTSKHIMGQQFCTLTQKVLDFKGILCF